MTTEQADPELFPMAPPVEIFPGPDGLTGIRMRFMPFDVAEITAPFVMPAYPATFFAPLGAVLVLWGSFEQAHDDLLVRVLARAGKGASKPGGFRARRTLLTKEASAMFEPSPPLLNYILDVLAKTDEPYDRRNVLAHGQLSGVISFDKPEGVPMLPEHVSVSITGNGERQRQPVTDSFTMRDLKALCYEIAHLAGCMHELVRSEPQIPGLDDAGKALLAEIRALELSAAR